MRIIDLRKAAAAAIVGGVCWGFGTTWAILDELEYRDLTDNPIPDPLAFGVTAIGSALLLLAFMSLRRVHTEQGATSGVSGYWISVAGFVLLLYPVWPFIFIGPLVLGIGATIYAGATLASGRTRSFGLWLHVLSIPVGTAVGFAFAWGGYDGGIGVATFMLMLITGYMTMTYDAAAYAEQPVASLAPEGVVTA